MNVSEFLRRLRFSVHRDQLSQELEEELRIHAEFRSDQLREQGMNSADASAAAQRKLGNPTLLKERARDSWSFLSFDAFWRQLKLAGRTLRHNPGFTATALVTLGLGIGANTAVFSLVDATLLRPLPYPHPERLGQLAISYKVGSAEGVSSFMDGRTWEMLRDHATALNCTVFSELGTDVGLASGGHVRYVRQQRVSAGYFRVLGTPPFLGREFTRSEDVDGGPSLAVVSYGVWKNVLNSARDVIGKQVRLRGESYTVVGVAPAGLQTASGAEIWTPLHPSTKGEGSNRNYAIIARVRNGFSWQQAQSQVEIIGSQRLSEQHDIPPNYKLKVTLLPLQQMLTSDLRTPLLLLWCGVITVLIIGCINVAGLLIARGSGRKQEMGTRMALGGGRTQVIHQLLVESLLLSCLAGLAGLVIGWFAIGAFRLVAHQALGIWQTINLDVRVLAVSLAFAFSTTLLFGIWPAVDASRVDIRTALLNSSNRAIAGSRSAWVRRFLISGEFALGITLLITCSLVVRSFLYLRNQPLGFDPHNVVAATLPLQDVRYRTNIKINRLFDEATARISAIPGVTAAGVAMSLPFERGLNTGLQIETGKPSNDTVLTYVTPGYFRTLSIPILRGRAFTAHDDTHSPRVGIVNEFLAKKYFGSADPIGRTVDQDGAMQIVGVISTIPMKGSLGGYAPVDSIPVVFVPAAQVSDGVFQLVDTWFTPSFVVRSAAQPRDIAPKMQKAIESVDPLLPFSGFHKIMDLRSQDLATQRFNALAMLSMAVLAVLLAAIGIYGLIAYTVSERRRELGIRMALGATMPQVIRSIAVPALFLATFGAAAGILASAGIVPLLRHIIWGISTTGATTYAVPTAILLVVAATAIVIPALRILRLNPADALRNE